MLTQLENSRVWGVWCLVKMSADFFDFFRVNINYLVRVWAVRYASMMLNTQVPDNTHVAHTFPTGYVLCTPRIRHPTGVSFSPKKAPRQAAWRASSVIRNSVVVLRISLVVLSLSYNPSNNGPLVRSGIYWVIWSNIGSRGFIVWRFCL